MTSTEANLVPLWYLSFAGEEGWLGGCYVRGEDEADVVRAAWRHGCNPGGQGQIVGPLPEGVVPAEKIGVLLDREGIELGLVE